MGSVVHFDQIERLAASALLGGAELRSPGHLYWPLAARCDSPVTVEVHGRPQQWVYDHTDPVYRDLMSQGAPAGLINAHGRAGNLRRLPAGGFEWSPGRNHALWVTLEVPCRKCPACLRARAAIWASKAREEIRCSSRTWFCTFTLNPDNHFRVESIARDADARNGDIFEQRSDADQYVRRCQIFGPEITRYIKRVRKESEAPLRYLFVSERHATGLPHWHALVHEVRPDKPVRKRVLQGQWRFGFSQAKLLPPDDAQATAWYVAKYLSKDMATRVRSSHHYGRVPTFVHSESVKLDTPEGRAALTGGG